VVAKALPQLARYDALAERAGGLPGYDRGREPDHGNGARRGSEP
jgi:hypothetical protein